MAFKTIASFEVLAQPIAPVPNVPFIQQGAFLQVSNLGPHNATVDLRYIGTPAFVVPPNPISLFTNYITQTGNANATSYPVATFLAAPVGFKALTIPPHATWLFGVQNILFPPNATPPAQGVDARGYIEIDATAGSKLLILATTRQVFSNFANGQLLDIAESAYPVPLATGPEVTF